MQKNRAFTLIELLVVIAVGNDVQVMQIIADEWKYAGKYGVDVKE